MTVQRWSGHFNEILEPGKPIVWDDSVKTFFTIPATEMALHKDQELTPYQWLTSDNPNAVQWRTDAEIGAWNAVYDKAASEGRGSHLTIPSTPIARPPTQSNRYFNIPGASTPKPAFKGKYFTIPADEEGA